MNDEGSWDLKELAEEDFEQLAVYIVPDAVVESGSSNRAEGSLPRNLVLKPSQALSDVLGVWSTDYIPRGTRFGPLVGQVYSKDNVPRQANRKYFWRVSDLLHRKLFQSVNARFVHRCTTIVNSSTTSMATMWPRPTGCVTSIRLTLPNRRI